MKFKDKKEEFIYWMRKSDLAKEHNDEEMYKIYIAKAKEVKNEIDASEIAKR